MPSIDFLLDEYCVGYDSNGLRLFNSDSLLDDSRGLSGTEINLFGNAVAMALRGHHVRIFSCFTRERTISDVELRQWSSYKAEKHANIAIAYHNALPLTFSKSRLNIVSEHTFEIPSPEVLVSGCVHVALSPSLHNLQTIRSRFAPHLPWYVLPNACDLGKIETWTPVKGRLLFHTSAERGLHLLLRALPEIRKAVPEARVSFIGSLEHLHYFGRLGSRHGEIAREITTRVAQESAHIDLMPRKGRNATLQHISTCAAFAYPVDPPIPCEVSPISLMECLHAGVPTVLLPADGIETLYGDGVELARDMRDFVDKTIAILTDETFATQLSRRGLIWSKNVSFEKSSEMLQWIINQHFPTDLIEIKSADMFLASTFSPPAVLAIAPSVPAPTAMRQKKAIFILSPMFVGRPFDPENISTSPHGLTGSDKAFLMLAREASRNGYDVKALSNFTSDGIFSGVECIRWHASSNDELLSKQWDLVACINDPQPLKHFKHAGVRYFNQQCNDFIRYPGWENYTDIASSPSARHLEYLRTLSSFSQWHVVPDGCDLSDFADLPRDRNKVIHASSPDRGLHWLLEMWPSFKQRHPGASLDIYYEWMSQYEHVKNHDGVFSLRYRMIKEGIERGRAFDVRHHGSASCQSIARAMSQARIMLYPCDTVAFTEGFSVATLESAAAGCVPVIVGVDALSDIYGGSLPVIPAPYTDNHRRFFETASALFTDDSLYRQYQEKAHEFASRHQWSDSFQRLMEII